jgi:hypothetical protein
LSGIVFDKKNLSYGTYKIDCKDQHKQSKSTSVQYSTSLNRNRNISGNYQGHENPAFGSNMKISDSTDNVKIIELDEETSYTTDHCCSNVWFRVKNYYTSPVNKFILYFVSINMIYYIMILLIVNPSHNILQYGVHVVILGRMYSSCTYHCDHTSWAY